MRSYGPRGTHAALSYLHMATPGDDDDGDILPGMPRAAALALATVAPQVGDDQLALAEAAAVSVLSLKIDLTEDAGAARAGWIERAREAVGPAAGLSAEQTYQRIEFLRSLTASIEGQMPARRAAVEEARRALADAQTPLETEVRTVQLAQLADEIADYEASKAELRDTLSKLRAAYDNALYSVDVARAQITVARDAQDTLEAALEQPERLAGARASMDVRAGAGPVRIELPRVALPGTLRVYASWQPLNVLAFAELEQDGAELDENDVESVAFNAPLQAARAARMAQNEGTWAEQGVRIDGLATGEQQAAAWSRTGATLAPGAWPVLVIAQPRDMHTGIWSLRVQDTTAAAAELRANTKAWLGAATDEAATLITRVVRYGLARPASTERALEPNALGALDMLLSDKVLADARNPAALDATDLANRRQVFADKSIELRDLALDTDTPQAVNAFEAATEELVQVARDGIADNSLTNGMLELAQNAVQANDQVAVARNDQEAARTDLQQYDAAVTGATNNPPALAAVLRDNGASRDDGAASEDPIKRIEASPALLDDVIDPRANPPATDVNVIAARQAFVGAFYAISDTNAVTAEEQDTLNKAAKNYENVTSEEQRQSVLDALNAQRSDVQGKITYYETLAGMAPLAELYDTVAIAELIEQFRALRAVAVEDATSKYENAQAAKSAAIDKFENALLNAPEPVSAKKKRSNAAGTATAPPPPPPSPPATAAANAAAAAPAPAAAAVESDEDSDVGAASGAASDTDAERRVKAQQIAMRRRGLRAPSSFRELVQSLVDSINALFVSLTANGPDVDQQADEVRMYWTELRRAAFVTAAANADIANVNVALSTVDESARYTDVAREFVDAARALLRGQPSTARTATLGQLALLGGNPVLASEASIPRAYLYVLPLAADDQLSAASVRTEDQVLVDMATVYNLDSTVNLRNAALLPDYGAAQRAVFNILVRGNPMDADEPRTYARYATVLNTTPANLPAGAGFPAHALWLALPVPRRTDAAWAAIVTHMPERATVEFALPPFEIAAGVRVLRTCVRDGTEYAELENTRDACTWALALTNDEARFVAQADALAATERDAREQAANAAAYTRDLGLADLLAEQADLLAELGSAAFVAAEARVYEARLALQSTDVQRAAQDAAQQAIDAQRAEQDAASNLQIAEEDFGVALLFDDAATTAEDKIKAAQEAFEDAQATAKQATRIARVLGERADTLSRAIGEMERALYAAVRHPEYVRAGEARARTAQLAQRIAAHPASALNATAQTAMRAAKAERDRLVTRWAVLCGGQSLENAAASVRGQRRIDSVPDWRGRHSATYRMPTPPRNSAPADRGDVPLVFASSAPLLARTAGNGSSYSVADRRTLLAEQVLALAVRGMPGTLRERGARAEVLALAAANAQDAAGLRAGVREHHAYMAASASLLSGVPAAAPAAAPANRNWSGGAFVPIGAYAQSAVACDLWSTSESPEHGEVTDEAQPLGCGMGGHGLAPLYADAAWTDNDDDNNTWGVGRGLGVGVGANWSDSESDASDSLDSWNSWDMPAVPPLGVRAVQAAPSPLGALPAPAARTTSPWSRAYAAWNSAARSASVSPSAEIAEQWHSAVQTANASVSDATAALRASPVLSRAGVSTWLEAALAHRDKLRSTAGALSAAVAQQV